MRRFLLVVNIIALMFGVCVSSLSQSVKSEKDLAKLENKYNKILLDLQGSGKSDKDYLKACKNMLKLSEENYTPAQIFIGDYYLKKNDIQNYEYWYVKAAENGDTTAQFELGLNYYKGKGLNQNYAKAIQWFTKLADGGNADAQYYLWNCYSAEGTQRDTVKAIYWLTKVAERGDTCAQRKLGVFYAKGQYATQDSSKAIYWFTKAAEQGNVAAQNTLGNSYYYGKGVEQDYSKAVSYYTKAAESGNVEAQLELFYCYMEGEGVQLDSLQIVNWLTKSAEAGNSEAQRILGNINIYENAQKAEYWLTKAAEQGNALAQKRLGEMYYLGTELPLDYSKAVH